MAHRRASASQGSISQQRQSLGEPYQIYTEVVNAGKNLQGSKRKIKWLFGFSESDSEHEVVLVHSLVSGKKTIFEDGKEIAVSINVLATDFSHGWNSEFCNRLFRIEASLGLTSEHLYTFSIDGVKFVDMPRKPLSSGGGPSKSFGAGGGNNSNDRTEAHRRTSTTGSIPNNAAPSRSNFQSPFANGGQSNQGNNSFDPFADQGGGGADFDPFGSSAPTNTKTTPTARSTPGSAGVTKPATKVTPTNNKSFTAGSQQSAATSLFGGFDDEASTHSGASQQNTNNHNTFDPFGNDSVGAGSDPFANHSTQPHVPAPQKKIEPKRSSVNVAPVVDLFDSAPVTVSPARAEPPHDPFSGSAALSGSHNKPQRRSSAQEISLDFEGLSFATPAPQNKAPVPEVAVVPPPPEPVAETSGPAVPKDPWDAAKNLVDLDLSGRTAAAAQRQNTRSSVTQGPSLDNLMGVTGGRRASFTSGSTATLSNNNNDPFGAPPVAVPMGFGNNNSSSYYGGGMGQPMAGGPAPMMMPAPPAAPVYGRGLAGGSAPMGVQQPPLNPFMAQSSMQAAPMNIRGSIGGMPGGYQPQQSQQQQQQKSSLDSLNWKM